MEKAVLKSFATEAREELINKVKLKANQYGITDEEIKTSEIVSSDSIVINGKALSSVEKKQRQKLIDRISTINEQGEDGYEHVMEEVAYTWFNRFIALRFMEVNDYLPTKIRVLTSTDPDSLEPDLLREANTVNLDVDKQIIYEYKINSDRDGLFKYMIISQCDALNVALPFMFEKTDHYTQLLFPDGLLNKDAFISRLTDVELIKEEWWTNVEIIGWLYQYYIASEKDRVIKAKKKYKKDEIPFATQLFTPDWIVRYMVQNTLGRYWIESHPEDEDLKANWEFYLESPNKEENFEEKLAPYINKELNVEDIKCFDPACGSGHILVYMFDVLYEIYERCGYVRKDIPKLIIEKNLYGLDIDDRAYQLACFAVVMKGMGYHNRLLRDIERQVERTGEGIKLNIASIQETNEFNEDDIAYLAGESSGEIYESAKKFIEAFKNAKTYGSLIKLEYFNVEFFKNRLFEIKNNIITNTFELESKNKFENNNKLNDLIKQMIIMNMQYDILVTNPPYMGNTYMNNKLNIFIKKYYEDVKSDLFAAFMKYCLEKVKLTGHLGFLTPYIWMFLSTYKKLRKTLLGKNNISSMVQLEYNSFPEACVPVCTFTLRNIDINLPGEYVRLVDYPGIAEQKNKLLEATNNHDISYRYTCFMDRYNQLPDNPIAYWIDEKILDLFKGDKIEDYAECKVGLQTGDNNRFLRYWYEVDFKNIEFKCTDIENTNKKWYPHSKGGEFKRWYGNKDFIVNWYNNGEEIRNFKDNLGKLRSRPQNTNFYFKKGITWSDLTSGKFSARYVEEGSIFDTTGPTLFAKNNNDLLYILGYFNSEIFQSLLDISCSGMHYSNGVISKLPIVFNDKIKKKVENIVSENIALIMNNYNLNETSYGFEINALLNNREDDNKLMESRIQNLKILNNLQMEKLKANELEINKLFNEILEIKSNKTMYNEKYSSISEFETKEEIKKFISYAIGCIFGRYSLDEDGIVYAGGEFNIDKYKTFKVNNDNIIPVLLDEYFDNDIVERFIEFVGITFGKDTLNENLKFIAETLGVRKNEMPKDTIRRYFLTDFYKDHLQTYKKRPIYWMFTSGKQKAFNCLIYMHRYDKSILAKIRTEYVHVVQDRMDSQKESLLEILNGDYSQKEKRDAQKELNLLEKRIDEIKNFEGKLHHMADKPFDIDLDDGVIYNYDLFKGLLAKI